jgi:hypothetical protein
MARYCEYSVLRTELYRALELGRYSVHTEPGIPRHTAVSEARYTTLLVNLARALGIHYIEQRCPVVVNNTTQANTEGYTEGIVHACMYHCARARTCCTSERRYSTAEISVL